MNFLIGLIAPIAAFAFGLLLFSPWVVPIQAACVVISCIPLNGFPRQAPKASELGSITLFFTFSFLGFLVKCGIPYVVGRGIRSIFA